MPIYSAKEPFSFDQDGVPRAFAAGTLISSDDPGFKGREHLFEPVEVAANRAVETASAAPGEVRNRKSARKSEGEPESETAVG